MDTINAISFLLGILSISYAIYNSRQFSKGVKVGALRSIRILINRLEEDKGKLKEDALAWSTMHHTQQDLEALFKNLKDMFNVSDKETPNS